MTAEQKALPTGGRPLLQNLLASRRGRLARALMQEQSQGLSTDQRRAFFDLIGPLAAGSGGTLRKLTGYAGTGKTFLTGRLCAVLAGLDVPIVCAAPTHKAAQQVALSLAEALPPGAGRPDTYTLSALLGLKMGPGRRGQLALAPAGRAKLPGSGGVAVVDEASMIGTRTWRHVRQLGKSCRWLFQGDMGQLPAVGEPSSPALTEPEGAELTEVLRQAEGNPIVAFGMAVRKGMRPTGRLARHLRGGEGVFCTRDRRAFIEAAGRAFREARRRGASGAVRVLAYRNARVDAYNAALREQARGGSGGPEYAAGEWLVARDTWHGPAGEGEEEPAIFNSETMQVTSAKAETDTGGLKGPWPVWRLHVRPEGRGETEILALRAEARGRYAELSERVRQDALQAKAKGQERRARRGFRTYFRLRGQYANVASARCTTVHKAQGSTFERVFVDVRDLMRPSAVSSVEKGGKQDLRQKLLYVAATRPRKRLGLLL
jgi:exodeoxyribonuclease-5